MKTNTPERVLLIETKEGVDRLHREAEASCETANAIHAVLPIPGDDAYEKTFKNPEKTFHNLLKASDPQIAKMADVLPIESFKVPEELKPVQEILCGRGRGCSRHNIKFDEATDQWVKDLEAINAEIDKNQYRRYATEPYQFKRIEISKALCEWLNGEKLFQQDVYDRFTDILKFNGDKTQWEMNPEWILKLEGYINLHRSNFQSRY